MASGDKSYNGGTNGQIGSSDNNSLWPSGGSYFLTGSHFGTQNGGGDLYGGGGGNLVYSSLGRGGNGGSGGSVQKITITVSSSTVLAQNGSSVTTSSSATQKWAAANKTKLRTQAVQGYGNGGGFTAVTSGTPVNFASAPAPPSSASAALVAGSDGSYRTVNVSFQKSPSDSVISYTIVDAKNGLNQTFLLANLAFNSNSNIYSASLLNLNSRSTYSFLVYANSNSASSLASFEALFFYYTFFFCVNFFCVNFSYPHLYLHMTQ